MAPVAVACAVAVLLSGCFLSPATNPADYGNKAGNSAQAMISNIQSADLAVSLELQGRSTGALTNDVVSDAESDADSVITAFDSRQPPSPPSETLKDEIDIPLEKAADGLTSLRIAVRQGDRAAMVRAVDALRVPLARLTKFYQQLS